MSERSAPTVDGLTQDVNEQILSCPICAETYTSMGDQLPKVLPCQHGLCEKCLKRIVSKSTRRYLTIQCPTCRMTSNIPVPGGVDSLPNNYMVLELLDIVKKHAVEEVVSPSSSRKRRALTCFYCDNSTAESACMGCHECDGIWCNECRDIHTGGKMYKSHILLTYDEYIEKADSKQSVTAPAPATGASVQVPRCSKHVSNDIDMFCAECECMICFVCFTSEHSGHRLVAIQEASKLKKQKVVEMRTVAKKHECALKSAKVSATRGRISYVRHVAGLEDRICSGAKRLHDMIANKEQEALREVRERTAESLDRLATQQHRLNSTVGRVREWIAAAKTVEQTEDDFEICRAALEVEVSLQPLLAEIEQVVQQPGNDLRLAMPADNVAKVESAASRLFNIVDESTLSLRLPKMSSVRAAATAMNRILKALSTAAQEKLKLGLQYKIMHVLDGVYSLACADVRMLRKLGAVNVCSYLVALLSCESVRTDPVLVEKGFQAAAALCQFRGDKSSNDIANIAALGEAGVCEAVIAALRLHGLASAAVAESGLSLIRNLTKVRSLKSLLRVAGACEEVVILLRRHGPAIAAVRKACIKIIDVLASSDASRGRLSAEGAGEEVIAALRADGYATAKVCTAGMDAIASLATNHDASSTRLRNAGAFEEIVAVLRNHGADVGVCKSSIAAVLRLSRHGFVSRFVDAGGCEELLAMLRAHSPTSAVVCEFSLRAIIVLASDENALVRLTRTDGEGCEEAVMTALRTHASTNPTICELSLQAIAKVVRNDAARVRLRGGGIFEELVAALSAHSSSSAVVCQAGMEAIATLADGDFEGDLDEDHRATLVHLGVAGALEEVVTALRTHGPTSNGVCIASMSAIRNLALDDETASRLLAAGAGEEVIASLRVHGSTDAEIGGVGLEAINNLALRDACRDQLRQIGVCEEVVGILRAHPDHLEIGEDGVDVVCLFAKDALGKARLVAAGARDVLEAMRNSQQHSQNHGAITSALANLD